MGGLSPMHWILVVLVVVLLFGGGRISALMGDVAKGIKSFKKGMADDDEPYLSATGTHIEAQRAADQSAGRSPVDERRG